MFGRRRGASRAASEAERSFWALRDINFSVQQGETLGIVGSNGAGKSTLLKILCRITKPTKGRARISGRIGSLLEVGTGFHPDLTGRENVYLNGAILGMRRDEIKRNFDEIVAFSEVERHLDTPVKFYSSGMYVRLAFSVAAHLEPEILIMDEVLAVGDAAFQRKCLDKMHRIRQEGRTIFFVSHNMGAITRLCRRALYLREGRLVTDGAAGDVVAEYLQTSHTLQAERAWDDIAIAPGDTCVRLRRVRTRTEDGETCSHFDVRDAVGIEITYDVLQPDHLLTPHIAVQNEEGVILFSAHDAERSELRRERAEYISVIWIPPNLLSVSTLRVQIMVVGRFGKAAQEVTHVQERDLLTFKVVDQRGRVFGDADTIGLPAGVVRPQLQWTTSQTPLDTTQSRGQS